jgi:hypothetical protein
VERRKFITLLGGAAAWPLAARAQQAERVRRIGVLTSQSERDPEYQTRYTVFRQTLQQLGWTEGRNVQIDYRWDSVGNSDLLRRHAAELVAHSGVGQPERSDVATHEPNRADCVRGCRRPDQRRLRRKPRATQALRAE